MIGLYHYVALAMFAAFVLLELTAQARPLPEIARWRLRCTASILLYFAAATYAPLLWDGWIGQYQLYNGAALPLWAQILGGFLLLELGIYAWHRTMHNVNPLWRWFHQLHHSAERIDVWGAFYFHPFDSLGWALLGSLALVGGFGITAEAAIVVNVVATFMGMFQHVNIRTPRWLGYIVQRPESHSYHHERGVHARNYGDLPLYDILFGTFYNPSGFAAENGFYEGGSAKVGPMLIGRQIA